MTRLDSGRSRGSAPWGLQAAAFFLFILFLLGWQGVTTAGDRETRLSSADFSCPEHVGTILSPQILEASGLAVSSGTAPLLWVVNDSGNPPLLFALAPSGRILSKWRITAPDTPSGTVLNRDWEDLALFRHQGSDYLILADVGDNKAARQDCSLAAVRLPTPKTGTGKTHSGAAAELPLAWQMRFGYEDGPRDCEAVAVDPALKEIVLLSKRQVPPVLYRLPLTMTPGKKRFTARKIGPIPHIPPPTARDLKTRYGSYRSQPTAMDISRDGTTLVILTYKDAYSFRRLKNRPWADAILQQPGRIQLPLPDTGVLVQREALAMDPVSGDLWITSEKIMAPIFRVRALPPQTD